ncbi:hypothetical protein SEVIR_9G228300v4 [Setaria viridis]|uniref:CCT domain-containing protein n=2 Tax=Setaria TaxID=4554 RepID=K4AAJ4_SETIT|nr:uncharacterized protein LOC101783902 isoform X2 [Setaria italica]XP_034573468.1 uncharacterized protein LOC117837804 isoform X2 [Setaria viridis]RCV42604.1 hypothetical protein SETIT_9G228800v2 [Setaria italica]TKV93482.1 hypothetical protein SEVIR_9G228300v2 [Setaria viridis]
MMISICTLQDGISSPIAAHILDFCDDGSGGDLFAAVNAASDMFTASSEDASSSSVTTPPAPCSHGDNVSSGAAAAASAFSPMASLDSTLSALLEEDDPPVPDTELFLPIDYQFAAAVAGDEPQPEQQFDQVPVALPVAAAAAEQPALQTQMSSTASELMHLTSSGYSDECFAAAMAGGGYVGLDEALCQQQPQPPLQPGALLPPGVMDTAAQGYAVAQGGFFGAGCTGMVMSMMGMEEIGEYQRMMESASAALSATHSADADSAAAAQMAAFGGSAGEMQMGGGMSPGQLPAAGAVTEASSLEDASFKSARISTEERREKIHRYIKKRNERNFSKKIKYACRKTLADSRPRVRGRFAKNDDYGEPSRAMQNHDEYDQIAGLKGEDMLDPDALQAHLSGMNSYMYNHTVESWM